MPRPAAARTSRPRSRVTQPLARLLACAAAALALLVGQRAGASNPVTNLKIADIYQGNSSKVVYLTWSGDNGVTFTVLRKLGGTTTTLGTTTSKFWSDNFNFSSGTTYQYMVRVGSDLTTQLQINATPVVVPLLENQTANSRTVDNQSGSGGANLILRVFRFQSSTYRGGLFTGYSGDASRIARSFLKFQASALPAGQSVWAGTVSAYWTRNFANGSTTVGCQVVSSDWGASTLNWTNAPPLTPAAATSTQTVTYNSASPNPGWYHWNLPICDALSHGTPASVGLASINETLAGWAYFAKQQYNASQAPVLIYAYGAPGGIDELSLWPTTVSGGADLNPALMRPSTSTGTVCLNGAAPTGGAVVQLTSSNPLVARVPDSVTVPAGGADATFTVTTLPVVTTTNVTITATYLSTVKTAVLTVVPLP